jgi:hypothetical protein
MRVCQFCIGFIRTTGRVLLNCFVAVRCRGSSQEYEQSEVDQSHAQERGRQQGHPQCGPDPRRSRFRGGACRLSRRGRS